MSEIYLAYKTKLAGESLAGSVTALAGALERAFDNHAQALHEAATASGKYAGRLNKATWALTVVTALLFLTAVAQVWVAYMALQ